ncbi:MAG: type I pullulanase [Erysipelotrichales bacterium]|nr:type I pullulanase [Erysipelotrichales bacterium]
MEKIVAKNEYTLEIIGYISNSSYVLEKNGKYVENICISNATIILRNKLEVGSRYQIKSDSEAYDVDLSQLVDLPSFDDKYFYDGELGAIVKNNVTTFRLFAPLAYLVNLVLYSDDKEKILSMNHLENGVHEIELEENLHESVYLYEIHQNGEVVRTQDPYSFATTINKEKSVVVDLERIKTEDTTQYLPSFTKNTEAIVYEASIRDLTSYPNSEIVDKGTFSGLLETNKKYKKCPIGIDYLKYLGITHVQFLPVNAFKGVDETRVKEEYNWGYNPYLYMALEGSLSKDPYSPLTRIYEFKNLVSELHKAGIRVNLDVVFNHVYEYKTSIFKKIVPNYYFRKRGALLSNGSFCGNDLDTSRKMVRKLIIDALKFFVNFYDVDGFRFDLLGIIDIKTSWEIQNELRKIKPNIMLYGEGWDMPTFLDYDLKTINSNANRLPSFAFFNDFYRDTLKGNNFNNYDRGYLVDNNYLKNAFKIAFKGYYNRLEAFNSPNQSINYIECHDNLTAYDKISYCLNTNDEEIILGVLKLCNAINILSFGIPFIHMGQEVGLTKFKEDNTYNMGDKYNQFDFEILSKRHSYAKYVRELIAFRKEYDCFKIDDYREIEKIVSYEEFDEHALKINYQLGDGKVLSILMNTSLKDNVYYTFEKGRKVLFNEAGRLKTDAYVQSLILAPLNVIIVINE